MEAQRRSRGQRWNLITCIFCIKQTNEFALTSSMPGVIAQTIYLFSKANKVPFVLICSNLCSLAMISYSPVFAQFWPFCTRGRMTGNPPELMIGVVRSWPEATCDKPDKPTNILYRQIPITDLRWDVARHLYGEPRLRPPGLPAPRVIAPPDPAPT